MTERWQKELRKLRSVGAPEQLRERVDNGPNGDDLPPMRQRVLAGVVAFAVFAGAGAFAWRALSPTARAPADVGGPQSEMVVRLDRPEATSATARYLGISQVLDARPYDPRQFGIIIPPEPELFPTAVPAGTQLLLRTDAPQAGIGVGSKGVGQGTINSAEKPGSQITLPSEPGRYVVDLWATWPDAHIQVLSRLLVEIAPRDMPIVTFTRDGGPKQGAISSPSAVLLWNGAATRLVPYEGSGSRGNGRLIPSCAITASVCPPADFVELPVGSRLAVAGDADTIEGFVNPPTVKGSDPPGDPIALEAGLPPVGPTGRSFEPLDRVGRAVLTFGLGWETGEQLEGTTASFFLPVDVVSAPSPTPTITPTPNGIVVIADGTTHESADDPVHVSIKMEIDGAEVEGVFGGSERTITFPDGTGTGSSAAAEIPRFRASDFVAVMEDTPFAVLGNAAELAASVSAGRDPFEGTKPFDPSAGFPDHLAPGPHVLEFDATWELGPTPILRHVTAQLTMYFPIEIVPVASPTPAGEDVLRIDCAADPVVGTPVVAAGLEGVDVRSPDAGNLAFKNLDTGQFLGWGTDTPLPAPDPGNRAVLPFDPGTWVVLCGGTGTSSGEFRVVDPLHAFRSSALACPADEQVDLVHRVSTAPDVSSEEELIRLLLPGIRGSDMVELAGYPERRDAYLYRVLRAGSVIAAVQPDRDQVMGRGCRGTGVDLGATGAA